MNIQQMISSSSLIACMLYYFIYIQCIDTIQQLLQPMSESKKHKGRQAELTKKLEKVTSINELKNILKSSRDQNKKLTDEVRELKERVQVIMNNHRVSIDEKISIKPENEKEHLMYRQVMEVRKQLKNKYSKMKQLKQEISLKSSSKIEEAQFNKMNNINNISSTEKSIKQLRKQLKDLQATNRKLQKTLESTMKNENVNQPRIDELQQQNKKLKTKISELRKHDYEKQLQSIVVQTTLVGNRKKMKDLEARKSMLDLKKMSMPDKNQIVESGLVDELKKEVAVLRKQVYIVEQSKNNEENEQKRRRNELYNNNKELVKKLKQIQLQKCKLQQQNNLWRKKWNDICRAIELHNKKIKKISTEAQMAEYVDLKPLRRDYAGILNRYRYEDRVILQDNKSVKIVGMMIYQIERGIVAMQAYYNNGQKTYLPIPQHFIQRCRVTKIECSENDFFKLFKIKYNSIDNKITKVEIRSNKNIKYQYGEKKQWSDLIEGDTIYGFDIGIKEYPVCAFGSYNYHKGYWLLEGFGVQINQLNQ